MVLTHLDMRDSPRLTRPGRTQRKIEPDPGPFDGSGFFLALDQQGVTGFDLTEMPQFIR